MTGLGKWLAAVRDHPDRLDDAQYRALVGLALRLDWKTGEGFASVAEVAADARCGRHTAMRAIAWALGRGLLDRTRRGRHVGRGASSRASEYRTCVPSQQITLPASQSRTGATLRGFARSHGERRKVAQEASQGRTGATPSKSYTSKSSTSTPRGASAADIIRAVYPDATDDEIEAIIKDRMRNGARSPEAVLIHEARQGALRLPCDPDGPGRHSGACRGGDGRNCFTDGNWCECRCHSAPAATVIGP